MKFYLQQIGAATLAVTISVATQQWIARTVVIAGQSSPTNAEQRQMSDSAPPTLKETGDWLKSNLEAYGGGCWHSGQNEPSSEEKFSDVSIDNSCRLSYRRSLVHSNGKAFNQQVISIPLGAVSDVQVQETSDGGDCGSWMSIAVRTGNIAGGADININREHSVSAGAIIPQSPAQMAPRIQKAIQHAVELCRGTYKAPPTAKEPF